MPIHVLDDDVISKISAGEVIERPVSVVKELIENAIDAGANEITVRIEAAGKKLIEIRDDGCGIAPEELKSAILRHATSKLTYADDLFHIHTLGFRGEALAAAGSVSRLTITSRTKEFPHGQRITMNGGKVTHYLADNLPSGTIVRVEDLFHNVPARLKFLKSDTTEKNLIDTLIARYALAYPHIRWEYQHENKTSLVTTGSGDAREVLAAIYGVEIAKQLLEVRQEEEALTVTGFISPVALTRSNRKEINFFVNGRWIQDAQLNAAVTRAYQSLIMVGRFPIAALFLTIDPEEIDVNVHPSKAEIRFRASDRVFSAVHRAVRFGLIAQSPVPEVASPMQWQTWSPTAAGRGNAAENFGGKPIEIDPAWTILHPAAPNATSPASAALQPNFDGAPGLAPVALPGTNLPAQPQAPRIFPILRWIGQIGGTYILAEGPDGLYLIDQHAAHERILFEQLLQSAGSDIGSQKLLDPAVVQLPPWQADLLENNLPVLEKLGFAIEPFGPSAFRVLAIPSLFTKGNPAAAVRSVVEDFEEDEEPLKAEIEKRIAGRVCKRMAVKAGQTLSESEQRALIRDLENCQSPRTCPHGRPTMIHMSINLLEQQFGRKGKI